MIMALAILIISGFPFSVNWVYAQETEEQRTERHIREAEEKIQNNRDQIIGKEEARQEKINSFNPNMKFDTSPVTVQKERNRVIQNINGTMVLMDASAIIESNQIKVFLSMDDTQAYVFVRGYFDGMFKPENRDVLLKFKKQLRIKNIVLQDKYSQRKENIPIE